ncbi:Hypothetical predicted protein [Marmota monax]|uniref:Essential for reactive oxygen species protein n=1 Tax=Marmota monax TaxID=9995 RepID=A0A5E4BNR4_MARMO|nr:Hypothetical predicted protein [Marmota monax]
MYMQVETRTNSCLHLKRAPGIRSWSLLVGILSTGLAAAYYSGDSLGWKLFYVTGCLFVAVQNLEDWEEAIFNKSTGKVVLKTFSLYRKLLTLLRAGHDQVVVLLNDIRDVNVEEEKVRYFGKGYMVVLRFATGFSHPLTQSAVMGRRRYAGWGPLWARLISHLPPSVLGHRGWDTGFQRKHNCGGLCMFEGSPAWHLQGKHRMWQGRVRDPVWELLYLDSRG